MTPRYQRAPDLLWRRTPSVVLVRSLDGQGWDIGGSGVVLWDELAEPATIPELVARLRESFLDESGSIVADVEATVGTLVADGVIVEVP